MMTFLSFLPIIITAIFVAFFGYLIISHEKDEKMKLKHHKRNHHHHKTA